jgi:hypothetical protein
MRGEIKMPQFNFEKQFAPAVESGKKRQTIRAKREDGRNPHVGDKLYLFVGQRTKGCRRIGEVICKEVHQITIDYTGINVDGEWLLTVAKNELARADGFNDYYEMKDFFRKKHGLPLEGLLYKW